MQGRVPAFAGENGSWMAGVPRARVPISGS
jgi:hypothetical protein